jgi:predicted RNA polymerase sigma factor
VDRAARMHRPGPYQLRAAIVACHAEASSWEETDWLQVLLLYDALVAQLPSAVVALDRPIAHGQALGLTANPAERALLEQRLTQATRRQDP